jgi:hypothetical protein
MNRHEQGNFQKNRIELTSINRRGYHGGMEDNAARKERHVNDGYANDYERHLYVVKGGKNERMSFFEGLGNAQARKGLEAYIILRPKDEWDAGDYARVAFMLNGDKSNAAARVRSGFINETKEKNIEEAFLIEEASINKKYIETIEKNGKIKEKDDLAFRVMEMNLELWNEKKGEGLKEISTNSLKQYYYYWTGLAMQVLDYPRGEEALRILGQLGDEIDGRPDVIVGNPPAPPDGGPPGGPGGVPPMPPDGGFWNRAEGYWSRTANAVESMLIELRGIREEIEVLTSAFVKDPTDNRFFSRIAEVTHRQLSIDARLAEAKREMGQEKDKDAELYEGSLSEVLEERMKRIRDFQTMSQSGLTNDLDPRADDVDSSDEEKLLRELNLEDSRNNRAILVERERLIREILRKDGMKKYRQRMYDYFRELRDEGRVEDQQRAYFGELQRRIGTIIKNSEYDGGSGALRNLPVASYRRFKQLYDLKKEDLMIKTGGELAGYVDELERLNFLNYFHDVESRVTTRGERMEQAGFLPLSIEETCQAADRQYGNEGWGIGGEYELIDRAGNFNIDNWMQFYRTRFIDQAEADPLSRIDSLNGWRLKIGWSELSIVQILTVPQYLQHRELELRGDARQLRDGGVTAVWGLPKDHPDLSLQRKIDQVVEIWRAGMKHNDWVALNQANVKNQRGEWLNAHYAQNNDNNYFRGGFYLERDLKLAKNGEAEAYYEDGKQGSLGKAIRDGTLFYRHLTEFSEFYLKDEHGRCRVRDFEDNMAYASLDYDGSSAFLLGIAEGAINRADASGEVDDVDENGNFVRGRKKSGGIKDVYKNFLLRQIGVIENNYRGRNLNTTQRDSINLFISEYRKKIARMGSHKTKIQFDNSSDLEELVFKIDRVAGNRSPDMKKEIGARVKRQLRQNIKRDFFDELMELEMVVIPEEDNGEKGRIEDYNNKEKIGNMRVEVVTDEDGAHRVITRDDRKKIGGANETLTIREIIDECFGNNAFALDQESLEDFENDFGLAQRNLEESRRNNAGDLVVRRAYRESKQKYERIFKRNELLGLVMLTKMANVSRRGLNTFRLATPDKREEDIMSEALQRSLATVYKLNKTEESYAYKEVWYTLKQFMVSSLNNTSGVAQGIDQGTVFNRFMLWRQTAFGLSTAGGGHDSLEEIKALVAPTRLDMTPVKMLGEGVASRSLLDVMQGTLPGEGRRIRHRWESERSLDDSQKYSIDTQTMITQFLNAFQYANNFIQEIVETQHFSFQNLVKRNMLGHAQFDHEKTRQVIDKYWNSLRNIYDVNNIDFEKKIAIDGREATILEHMFGERVMGTRAGLEVYYKKMASKLRDRAGARTTEKAEKMRKDAEAYEVYARRVKAQPAIAVLTSLVAMTIHEHMDPKNTHEDWNLRDVENMWFVLDHYLRLSGGIEWHGNKAHVRHMPSMLPYAALDEAMRLDDGKSTMWYMFRDLLVNLAAGGFAGIVKALEEASDEVAQIEKVTLA